jgi:DNA-binding transcriptional regulator YhcF (GntR family)
VSPPKYQRVAESIRAQIAEGMLRPGEPAPSGAALARATGYSTLTCRKALSRLIKDGVLIPGASPGARPRVPARTPTRGGRTLASAARALSESLAARRRGAGLTQPQLAELLGVSVTSVGHAETGRLWQSRRFWEHVDKGLSTDGELLALHDAYRAAPADTATKAEDIDTETPADTSPTIAVAVSAPVTCVNITWADGEVTTVYPPEAPARPANATPANWPHG